MRIQYVTNRVQRTVRDELGRHLIRRGIAREVVQTEVASITETAPTVKIVDKPVQSTGNELATVKAKRQYKRRDMRPED